MDCHSTRYHCAYSFGLSVDPALDRLVHEMGAHDLSWSLEDNARLIVLAYASLECLHQKEKRPPLKLVIESRSEYSAQK